ncbi:hypothetical protein [Sphingomonas sp. PWP1-2]|uniref:hypothetical protein n=1 Tax=Sphingomonas sp. PWP1-2 TaxID=2804558 RepID=UPI003CED95D6
MMETSLILENAGFRVHECFDGDEAITLLIEHWESTVLLFSDVDMPGTIMDLRSRGTSLSIGR